MGHGHRNGEVHSYRRQDTQHLAGRLHDRLRGQLGKERVFMDVDSIEPGLDVGKATLNKPVRIIPVLFDDDTKRLIDTLQRVLATT